jgi:tRNA 2-selenouridine synthase
VEQLLVEHYDPAYLRSIDRNFSRFGQAAQVELADISEQAFRAAAKNLLEDERADTYKHPEPAM